MENDYVIIKIKKSALKDIAPLDILDSDLNVVDEFLLDSIDMWIDNFADNVEFEDYTIEDLDKIDRQKVLEKVKSYDTWWEYLDEDIQFALNKEIFGGKNGK